MCRCNTRIWNIENIEIKRLFTESIAKELDKKDGGNTYRRDYALMIENPNIPKFKERSYTERFNTFEEVINAGIIKWKELNID